MKNIAFERVIDGSEANLLLVLSSYKDGTVFSLTEVAKQINRSVRTVQRQMKSLEGKGIIKKDYVAFKKLRISLIKEIHEACISSPS